MDDECGESMEPMEEEKELGDAELDSLVRGLHNVAFVSFLAHSASIDHSCFPCQLTQLKSLEIVPMRLKVESQHASVILTRRVLKRFCSKNSDVIG